MVFDANDGTLITSRGYSGNRFLNYLAKSIIVTSGPTYIAYIVSRY